MNDEERWTPETIKGLVIDAVPMMQHLGVNLDQALPEGPLDTSKCIALIALGTVLLKESGVSYRNYLELCACLYSRSVLAHKASDDA